MEARRAAGLHSYALLVAPSGCDVLTKKSVCREKQPTPPPRVLSSDARVASGGQSQTVQPGQPAQHPLTPDDCVIAKRSERKPFRPLPASARGSHGRERGECA